MKDLLIDTHAALWLVRGAEDLGPKARRTMVLAIRQDGLLMSAITCWEVALLAAKGRLNMPNPEDWRRRVLDLGIGEVPVSGGIAIAAVLLDGLHADPADRIIVATAQSQGATLVTADKRLLAWPGRLDRLDARS